MKKNLQLKKKKAQQRHKDAKLRARYKRVTNQYSRYQRTDVFGQVRATDGWTNFHLMMDDLSTLNLKVLQILLRDLQDIYIGPWSGEYHSRFKSTIETFILERTLLK